MLNLNSGYNFRAPATQSNNGLDTQFRSLWELGPLCRFGPLGPPALPGLPMASYATEFKILQGKVRSATSVKLSTYSELL